MNVKIFFYSLMLLLATQVVQAEEAIQFTATAPKSVVMGQQFRLVFSANQEISDFRMGEMNDFDVLMGPSTSTMRSSQIVNGQRSSSVTYSFTYVLMPKKTGTFQLSPATAKYKRNTIQSNALRIEVLPEDQQATADQSTASTNVQADQAFIRAIPSKTTVYEQEGLTITYKLYSKVDISGFDNPKFPEFKGFMAQEVDLPQNQQWNLEHYNGSNYRTAVLKQTVLYPRETGTLTIDRGSFDLLLRIRVNNPRMRSIFDDFFESYQDVKKTVYSNPVQIQVKPLPSGKPAGFTGITGKLKLDSEISTTELKANEAVTLTLTLTGTGNLKMLPTPEIEFPQDFEVYDPKVNNQFTNNSAGVTGSKTIEYLVIPRFGGEFVIPAVHVSYFDASKGSYEQLTAGPWTLNVAKSANETNTGVAAGMVNKEQLKLLGSDIRYIKTDFNLRASEETLYGSWYFGLYYLLSSFVLVLILFINRKRARENADITALRHRKASKVANKRLKTAAQYLKNDKKEAFYEEVLKAVWGYTSDKLSIPVSELNKDNVVIRLQERGVSDEVCKTFIDILETCEMARYAPESGHRAMDDLYGQTQEVMNRMENTIKK